jgi:SHS2 domain-containing protein
MSELSAPRAAEDFDYFDHDADVGIVGRGATLEAAFEAAASAVFGIMAELPAVRPETAVRVEFEEPDAELALVQWLNGLLAAAQKAGLVLSRFRLRWDGAHWTGQGWGEPWRDTLERGVEVKGATLTMLAVRPVTDGWEARCVVDV